MRGDEVRAKRERALVRARRFGEVALHLQRDAVVVMRLAVGHVRAQRARERGGRRGAVAPREMRAPERAQEPAVRGRAREPSRHSATAASRSPAASAAFAAASRAST